jgi:hypothetical protein
MNTAIIIGCFSTFPAFFNKSKSLSSGLQSTIRLRLNSWRSAISHTTSASSLDSAIKKDSKADDSWHGDTIKLDDDKSDVSRSAVREDGFRLQTVTNSQDRESVDIQGSQMEQQGIVRTVNFDVEYSRNENR